MLAGFYTDACGNEGLGRCLSWLSSLGSKARLLKNRSVPQSVLPFTHSFPLATATDHLLNSGTTFTPQSRTLGLAMTLAGDCGANMIYSSLGWSTHFLARAKSRGLTVVTEFYVRPSLWRVHQEEYLQFPEWEEVMPYANVEESTEEGLALRDYSDHLLVPAQGVKNDIVNEGLFDASRIHIVPYGIGQEFFDIENRPVPGRVLFVGSCTLVKGIHCLALASEIVAKLPGSVSPEFIAAGEVTERVRQHPACSQVKFLGRVPRMEVNRLYADADVLVFPTLSDAFGMVMLEAMAAGIPVICSPYCGEVVEHGVSGLVVYPSDSERLADAIHTIINDRPLRTQMSEAAKVRAHQFTTEANARLLTSTLRDIHKSGQPAASAKV
jgi:glycosyltransferase involved in cell wall biosynthesis